MEEENKETYRKYCKKLMTWRLVVMRCRSQIRYYGTKRVIAVAVERFEPQLG